MASVLGVVVKHSSFLLPSVERTLRHKSPLFHFFPSGIILCIVAWLTLACLADKVGLFVAHKVKSGLILLETVDL